MALSDETLNAIDRCLASKDLAVAVSSLRSGMAGLVLLQCDAEDVLEDPYRGYAGFDLHLVDTRDHCVAMTSDPARATGVLIARKAAAS